jgi:two-component system response regulator AtoC
VHDSLTLSLDGLPTGASAPPAHVVVVDGDTAWVVPLPAAGELVIGRAPEAHVRVADASVSRLHLKLLVSPHEVRALDLGSSHGTKVNGEVIHSARPLCSGDVLQLSAAVTLIFHRDRAPLRERALLDSGAFAVRLGEELDRALHYHRPLALIVLDAGPDVPAPALLAALAGRVRSVDIPGWTTTQRLALLAPELDAPAALAAAQRLLAALGPQARAGVAVCPHDAADRDALLSAALAALDLAAAGRAALAHQTATTRTIGERTIVVADPAMQRLYALLDRLAATDVAVLIRGETGAGKELVAQALHHGSPRRRSGPFVAINCAALPEQLVESQLFGHEKGAFSGADTAKAGLFEAASGGTFFLDELGELSPAIQAKLLRVLETQRVLRLGDTRERPIDVRVVCATHRDVEAEVKAGRFRQDLYYRLSSARVVLPPLRQRPREIPILADALLDDLARQHQLPRRSLTAAAKQALLRHDWPGNVRELRNALELALVTAEGDSIEPWHLPEQLSASATTTTTSTPPPAVERAFRPIDEEVRELERTRMSEALVVADGNQTRAAELIGMPLRTFVTKLKQYGLSARTPRARA